MSSSHVDTKMSCQSFSSTDYTFSEVFSISRVRDEIFVKRLYEGVIQLSSTQHGEARRSICQVGKTRLTLVLPQMEQKHIDPESNGICLRESKLRKLLMS